MADAKRSVPDRLRRRWVVTTILLLPALWVPLMYGPRIWFAVAYTHAVPADLLTTRYGRSSAPGGKLAHKRSAVFPGPEWVILRDGKLRSLEQSSIQLHDPWCGACNE